jgi:23S rRNA (uracil1939-C5)-methyltransferase
MTHPTQDKVAALSRALESAGYLDAPIAPLITFPENTRRRVDLGATRIAGTISLGLHKPRSPEVIDLLEDTVTRPEILALLPNLRILLRSLESFRRTGEVLINWLDRGPDIVLRMDAAFTGPDRAKIIAFARANHLLRISIATGEEIPEPVIILSPPVITFSGTPVEPPPGGFLQASADAETAIIAAVLKGLPKLTNKSRLVELFAGSGTLSFALAQHARVEAYEGDAMAVASHDKAIRTNNLAGRMSVTQRDLHRRPLQPADMSGAACVILDPPYAGAPQQMRFLTASTVKRVIYVSCNPEALTTDAAALRRAGFLLVSATPIDQFQNSENLESVVVFNKPK